MSEVGLGESDRLAAEVGKPPGPWGETGSYFLTRDVFLRALGAVYVVAFWILVRQGDGLIGSQGLLPARHFLDAVHRNEGAAAFLELPTLFWLGCSDGALAVASWLGAGLGLVVLAGLGNAIVLGVLWLLYLSFVHVGQIFYGYGWEMLLCEVGFLAIFFAPPLRPGAFRRSPPPVQVVWLLRWVLFRLMFGAGLIKLRGDPCWTALTCLAEHYETQPNPGPLSPYFDALPLWADKAGVLFNHAAELIAPFGLLGPRRVRHGAGLVVVAFQSLLILSGNLSFFNWLTIVVALAVFDDQAWLEVVPPSLRARLRAKIAAVAEEAVVSRGRRRVIHGLVAVVVMLSLAPTFNLMMPDQRMNASFDPLHLVNTYGAFGSVDHERHEVVIEGTRGDPLSGDVEWKEYGFPCKPSDVNRRPCLVTPYHYRLDWQMWFAGHHDEARDTWFFRLVQELLRGNPHVTRLLQDDPFEGTRPRYVRALLYRYEFAHDGRSVWKRELLGEYLRPLSLDDAVLGEVLRRRGFPPQR